MSPSLQRAALFLSRRGPHMRHIFTGLARAQSPATGSNFGCGVVMRFFSNCQKTLGTT